MLRAVLDTNVFVSALFGGTPEDVYRAALRGRFVLITSPAILAELAGVMRVKLATPEHDIIAFVRQIARHAKIRPTVRLSVLEDDPDNRVLECAVEGKADLPVSGDRHLQRLEAHTGIQVVRPAAFLRWLESEAQNTAP